MNRKSRYSLLAFGFLFFLFAAPIIVLYVRGVSFDFNSHTFVKTGILSVITEPKDVDIYLDGALKRQSSGDIKFVPAGEYKVEVKKQGYFPWEKRLRVAAGEVTWASPDFNKIYLLYQNSTPKTLIGGILDFYKNGDSIAALSKDAFMFSGSGNFDSRAAYPLPKPVDKILGADTALVNFILINSKSPTTILIFNSTSGEFFDLTGLFSSLPKFQFSGSSLYALAGETLYKIDAAKKIKTPLLNGVLSYYFLNNSLYYIQAEAKSSTLLVALAPYSLGQELLSGLPDLSGAEMLVTPQKQIFIAKGTDLYLAVETLRKLADNVSLWSFDPATSVLSVIHAGQFDYFDPYASTLNFATRSTGQLTNPAILTKIGYAFFKQENSINSIELDTRSGQNQYLLYQGQNLQKFSIDSDAKNILFLDNGDLKNINIR